MQNKQTKLLFESWREFLSEEDVLAKKGSWDDAANKLATTIKEPYEKFVSDLKGLVADPKVQAILKYGKKDGAPEDELTETKRIDAPVVGLKPTQNEIALDKSLGGKYGPLENPNVARICLAGGAVTVPSAVEGAPIVTAEDGKLIIDGHHRWSMLYCCDKDAKIKALDIKKPGLKPFDYLKIVQMAIAASSGRVPSATAKGSINLITITEDVLKQYVIKNLKPEALKVWSEKGKGKTPEEVANYIWSNVQSMQKTGVPVAGSPKRDFMPQIDTAPNAIGTLEAGTINFKAPTQGEYPGKGKPAQTGKQVTKESLENKIKKIIKEEIQKLKK